ncbi:hypothetical protein CU044_7388 [Streptomyces sp. L-9-10]|nr:hypothetical protein CU044_7388 [Streptomyces sp. L-9-10]
MRREDPCAARRPLDRPGPGLIGYSLPWCCQGAADPVSISAKISISTKKGTPCFGC